MKKSFKLIIDNTREIEIKIENIHRATITDKDGTKETVYTLDQKDENNGIIEDTIKMVEYVHNMMAVKEGIDYITIAVNSNSKSEVDKDYIVIADSLVKIFKGEIGIQDGSASVSSGYSTLQKYLGY